MASGNRYRVFLPDGKGKIDGIDNNWSISQLIEQLPALFKESAPKSEKELVSTASLESLNSIIEYYQQKETLFAEIIDLYQSEEYNSILVEDDYSLIRIVGFPQGSQHYIELSLPDLSLKDHSLPSCLDWQELLGKSEDISSSTSTSLSLKGLVEQFSSYLNDLNDFYDNFRNIDELCYVVRPAKPSTKDNWRMFVLKERVFLKITFADPFAPLASMTINIIGPTREISSLRTIYSNGLQDWDPEMDIHKNLLRIFNLCYFPMPPVSNVCENVSVNSLAEPEIEQKCCSICYSYELDDDDGEIPIISCDNSRCSLISHISCLRRWFNTLADGKTYLNVTFGICPFCKTVVTKYI